MESKRISSSEDLSEFSPSRDSPTRLYTNKHYYNDCATEKRKSFRRLQRSKNSKLSNNSIQENSLMENTEPSYQRASRKSTSKVKIKDCEKNTLRASAGKSKLADRQVKIGSLSTSSTGCRNSSYQKNENCQIPNEKKERNSGKDSLKGATDIRKSNSNEKPLEIMEIEVFMPLIDVKRNAVIYPNYKQPIIRRYFLNKGDILKRKEDIKKNAHSAKKNDRHSSKKSHLHSNAKKNFKENSNKIVSKPARKSQEANTVKIASAGKKPKDLEVENVKNLDEKSAVEFQNSRHITSDSESLPLPWSERRTSLEFQNSIGSKTDTKTLSREQDCALESRNIREITNDTDNIPLSVASSEGMEEVEFQSLGLVRSKNDKPSLSCVGTKSERANKSQTEDYTSSKLVSTEMPVADKIKDHSTIQNFRNIHKLVYYPVTKLYMEEMRKTGMKDTFKNYTIDLEKSKENASVNRRKSCEGKINFPFKIEDMHKQLILRKLNGSNSFDYGTLTKTKNNENGRRRIVPAHSSRGSSGVRKCRRQASDDGVSMQCWIERCQHLLNRDRHLQKIQYGSPWRTC